MTKTLELLGYAPGDRVLIIHADDVGFSHASNVAAFEGMLQGSLTCASAMVPAPWFSETAKLQRENPEADIGVHLTLTCEFETCRWRALTGQERAPGLYAKDGGMRRTAEAALEHVSFDEARMEFRAQIALALADGIDVTHVDPHTRAVMDPRFLEAYVDLAIEFRLPLLFPRLSERRLAALGASAAAYTDQARKLEAGGWPLLDNVIHRTLSEIEPDDKEAAFCKLFAELRPGLTHFLVHPAAGGEELQAITPRDAAHRAREGELFRDRSMRDYCKGLGIKLTGYRAIRDQLRASLGA